MDEENQQGGCFILILLLVIAAGVRLFELNAAPLDFHPTRQYRFAHIARDIHLADKKLTGNEKAVWEETHKQINKAMPSKANLPTTSPPRLPKKYFTTTIRTATN